ncbi:MAG: ATP-binding cassette domain-containing protein, partial [Bdellovibrionota bacterium]
MTQTLPLLRMSRIGKSFGPVRALEDVSLEVRPGEVLALLGENGAGKSTLMKILSGVWPEGSYDGSFELQGQSMRFRDTRQAFSAGIAMIHQELAVFPELTVAEHLELTELPNFIRWDDLNRRVAAFLSRIDFDRLGLAPETKVGTLSVGGRQLVEIARALYRDAKVIVFDEPTSALTEPEVQVLYGVIERLRKEGRGILYISHRLDEVFRLADRVVILRDGRFVAQAPMAARAELEPQII